MMVLFGVSLTLTGCQITEESRVISSAKTMGELAAQRPLDTPPECDDHMNRVIPKVGEKARWSQKRWEYMADQIDAQIDSCAKFHRDKDSALAM